eukprot:Pgem_evm1s16179
MKTSMKFTIDLFSEVNGIVSSESLILNGKMITKWVEEEVGVAGLDLNPNYKAQFQLNYNTQTRSFNSHLSGIGNVRGKNKDYFVDYDIPITSNRCY